MVRLPKRIFRAVAAEPARCGAALLPGIEAAIGHAAAAVAAAHGTEPLLEERFRLRIGRRVGRRHSDQCSKCDQSCTHEALLTFALRRLVYNPDRAPMKCARGWRGSASRLRHDRPMAKWRPDMTADERAIRDLVAAWMAASQAGDLKTVLGLMTDDVVFMVPGREPFGKEAFAAASQGMKDVRMQGTSDIRELVVQGDIAYLRNHIQITITPPGGEPVRRAGYTLTILRKQPDGRWLLAR